MKSYRVVLIALLLASSLWAQSEGDASETSTPTSAPVLPSSISGGMTPVDTVRETQRSREWLGRIGFTATCDNNVFLTAQNASSDCSFVSQPALSFRQKGSRSNWDINYMPSFTAYRRYSSLNELDQTLGIDAQYRVTRRVTVRIREAFTKRNSFSNGLPTYVDVPSFGLIQRTNDVVITPPANEIRTTTGADVTYQLSATSYAGISTTYSDQQYSISGPGTGLARTQAGTVTAVYGHRISKIHWIGVNYTFEHLRIGGTDSIDINSILYTHTLVFGPGLSVSGFVGPEYSQHHDQTVGPTPGITTSAVSWDRWSPVVGGSVGWASKYNTLQGSFVHRVNDSGGLFGAAAVSSVAVGFMRRINSRLSGNLGGSYGDTLALFSSAVPAGAVSQVQSASLHVGFDYILRRNLTWSTYYVRDWQQSLTGAVHARMGRDRAAVSIAYSFGRPLGR